MTSDDLDPAAAGFEAQNLQCTSSTKDKSKANKRRKSNYQQTLQTRKNMPKENRSTVNKSNRHLFSAISSSTSPSESIQITCHEKPVDLTNESEIEHSVSEVPTDDESIPLEVRLTTTTLKEFSDSENSNHYEFHDIIPPRMPVPPVKHAQVDTNETSNTSALFQVADYSSDSD